MKGLRLTRARSATLLLVTALVVASIVVVAQLQRRDADGMPADCHRWHQLLRKRLAEDTALVGAEMARQFRVEALRRGRIDVGGHEVLRPEGC